MQWRAQDIIDWLLTKGTALPSIQALTKELGVQFVATGAPIVRMRVAIRTVHPLMAAFTTTWEQDTGPVDPNISAHGLEQRRDYAGSPMAIAAETRETFRKDLTNLGADDHETLFELQARGACDYFCIPLLFANGIAGLWVVVSDKKDGLSDDEVASLHQIGRILSPIIEVHRLNRLSTAVAEAYLGQRTGHRVLGGDITRGHVDQIDAAILVSDLRGWTRLNTELPVEEAVSVANGYFEILDQAITHQGGEILKFMGDGVLAVFPVTEGRSAAANKAMLAASDALSHATEQIRFGIGLHIGNVLYGNVGSPSRLDFTVLGAAVNMAARIEALCSETGRSVLMSDTFAGLLVSPTRQLGQFSLKGLDQGATVFTI